MSRTTLTILALLAVSAGCRKTPPPGAQLADAGVVADAATHKEHDHASEENAGRPDDHDEHGHGEASEKRSDLDQPVDALLAQSCEHGKKSFECDECRYSVGVVRVPKAMLDDGLLKTAVVARRKLEAPLSLTGEIRFDERRVTHWARSRASGRGATRARSAPASRSSASRPRRGAPRAPGSPCAPRG